MQNDLKPLEINIIPITLYMTSFLGNWASAIELALLDVKVFAII